MKYREPEIVIPELEKQVGTCAAHVAWTDAQDRTLQRYYNKVPVRSLAKHCGGRSIHAVQQRAYILGLTGVGR